MLYLAAFVTGIACGVWLSWLLRRPDPRIADLEGRCDLYQRALRDACSDMETLSNQLIARDSAAEDRMMERAVEVDDGR